MFASLVHAAVTYTTEYTTTTTTSAGSSAASNIFYGIFAVIVLISMWKLFAKAGKPGWGAIVPFYNMYLELEIAGRPWWWLLMMFVPFVNVVFAIILTLDFVRSYGKSTGYGVLTIFFGIITYPMMAFSKDVKYVGPYAAHGAAGMPSTTPPTAPMAPVAPVAPTMPTTPSEPTTPVAPQPPVNTPPTNPIQ